MTVQKGKGQKNIRFTVLKIHSITTTKFSFNYVISIMLKVKSLKLCFDVKANILQHVKHTFTYFFINFLREGQQAYEFTISVRVWMRCISNFKPEG